MTNIRGYATDEKYWPSRWAPLEQLIADGVPQDFRSGNLTQPFENLAGREIVERLFEFVSRQGTPAEWCIESNVGGPKAYKIGPDSLLMSRASVEHGYMAHLIAEKLRELGRAHMVQQAVEIGGGFGGLALRCLESLGVHGYELVDAPPMLKIQGAFLTRAGRVPTSERHRGFLLTKPGTWRQSDRRYDLAIATRCFGEMSTATARDYIERIFARLNEGGLFFVVTWRQKVSTWQGLRIQGLSWRYQSVTEWPRQIDPNPMFCGYFAK